MSHHPSIGCRWATFGLAALLISCREGPKPASEPLEGTAVPTVEPAEGEAGRVQLSEAAFAAAGIVVEQPRQLSSRREATTLAVPGQVEADPSRVALITPRAQGRLERLAASVGERIATGQTVAYLLSSEFVTAQSDLVQAARRATALMASPDSGVGARTLEAARRRLGLLGLGPEAIGRIERTGETLDLLPIAAPFGGSLVEMLALPGAALAPGQPIFRLIDLSEVDVVGNVPEAEMPHLAVGQTADVIPTAYPDARFSGRIERIKDELDPSTRTVAAVIHVRNPRGILKPGMFATVRIAVPLARRAEVVAGQASGFVLPESAILIQGNDRFVFVEVALRTYQRRMVDALALDEVGVGPRRVLVRGGLTADDRVVVQGTFTLKSELAKGELEEH
ncbi:MAG: efflux RND transporter periplasmic adaptor subunit [Gemmatimonadales bacterium]